MFKALLHEAVFPATRLAILLRHCELQGKLLSVPHPEINMSHNVFVAASVARSSFAAIAVTLQRFMRCQGVLNLRPGHTVQHCVQYCAQHFSLSVATRCNIRATFAGFSLLNKILQNILLLSAILRAISGVDTRCNSAIARNISLNVALCVRAFSNVLW